MFYGVSNESWYCYLDIVYITSLLFMVIQACIKIIKEVFGEIICKGKLFATFNSKWSLSNQRTN